MADLLSLASRGTQMEIAKTNVAECGATLSASEREILLNIKEEVIEVQPSISVDPHDITELLQESADKLQPRKDCLNGATRKRLRRLIVNGVSYEQARQVALQPISPRDKVRKRHISNDSTPGKVEKKRRFETVVEPLSEQQMPQETDSAIPAFRQTLDETKVGIIHAGYPDENLNTDQMNAIQEAIIEKVLALDSSTKPKFLGAIFRTGYLQINCADETALKWLCSVVPEMKPWEGAVLKTLVGDELPKAHVVNAFFPNSAEDSNEKILKLVKQHNVGFHTTNWKVLKRMTRGKNTVYLVTVIDEQSTAVLRKINCRVSFKFGEATIRAKGIKPKEMFNSGKSKESDKPDTAKPSSRQTISLGKQSTEDRSNRPVGSGNLFDVRSSAIISTVLKKRITGLPAKKAGGRNPQIKGANNLYVGPFEKPYK